MQTLDALRVGLDGGLIEASAGTGKTYTITTLFLRLVLERGLTVGEILVVTFTKAATAELRDRIRRRLRQALAAVDAPPDPPDEVLSALVAARADPGAARSRLQAALRDFDEAAIFTIHGFCQRILGDHAFESGADFGATLVANQDQLLAEVVNDYWAESLYQASPGWVRRVLARGLTPERLRRLAAVGVADPEMPIVPEPVTTASLEAAEARLDEAHRAAAAIWRAGRRDILGKLSVVKYQSRWLEGWAATLDDVLGDGQAARVAEFEKFTRFTTAELAGNVKKGQAPPAHPFFTACDRLLETSEAATRAVEDRLLVFRRELIAYARREVPRRREAARVQGFDDLLRRVDQALQGSGGPVLGRALRATYKTALIDEFQDTDPEQYRIFGAIYAGAGPTGMFLIGDPKQAIYSFRGADVFAYLRAARDAGARTYTLARNHRSAPALLRAVNTLFARARAPFLLGDIAFLPVEAAPGAEEKLLGAGAPFRVLFAPCEGDAKQRINKDRGNREVPKAVAADIARLLGSGATLDGHPVSAGDVAVLVRKNRQAAAVQEALRALGVPSVLQGNASVFDAPEALEAQRIMAAMIELGDGGALRLALSTSLFGLDAGELQALESDDGAWDHWTSCFGAWGKAWESQGFIAAFRRLLDQQKAVPRLLALVDGERRLTNVLHLAELLHVAATREHLGPGALLRWLARMRRDQAAREGFGAEAAEVRLESDDRAVKLVTIHKSKGLEYPIVYCPFLWDGRLLGADAKEALLFHDPERDHRSTLALGADEIAAHERQAEREAAAENLRLLYVALTRAKHQVSVVWGRFKGAETSPLAYLLHQAREDASDLFTATQTRFGTMDDGAVLGDLQALAAAAAGAIDIEAPSFAPGGFFQPPKTEAAVLRCRAVTRLIEHGWRTSSFSALVSEGGADTARDAADRDRSAPPEPERKAEAIAVEPVRLHAFPRGPRPGELIHKLFELVDFTAPEAEIAAHVARQLGRFRLPVAPWQDILTSAVRDVLATPLEIPGAAGEAAFTLDRIPRDRRLSELEFLLPVEPGAGPTTAARRLLTRGALADTFARHARPGLSADYGERLRRLPFAPMEGFLRGFIDLVFEQDGRFYVADYKSNFLGPAPADYAPPALAEAMVHHHYILQYHLYAVALHRYLARRIAGYDYDEHFGGALYLFVRGMGPDHSAGAGVFADRPPRALIEALSRLFAGAEVAS